MRLAFSNLLPYLPLLATGFPSVNALMEALTPQPSASQVCTLLRSPCLSRLNFRTFRLQTPYCHFATLGFLRYGFFHRRRRRTIPAVLAATRSWATSWIIVRSEVRELLGRSPTGLAESSSLSLRTARSIPDALHPFFRKRSFSSLREGNVFPDRDFHSTIQSPSQAH